MIFKANRIRPIFPRHEPPEPTQLMDLQDFRRACLVDNIRGLQKKYLCGLERFSPPFPLNLCSRFSSAERTD